MAQQLSSAYSKDKWRRMSEIVASQQPLISPAAQTRQFNLLRLKRFIALNFIMMALQYAGLAISTLVSPNFPMWFASGVACGLIFMYGPRILPGIWLGSFLAYFFLKAGVVQPPFVYATIFALQAWLLLWLSYRYVTPTLLFYTRTTFFKFILLSAILTAVTTLTLELFSHLAFNNPQSSFMLWLQWWLANLVGLLIFSFALITADSYFPQFALLRRKSITVYVYYAILIMLAASVLFSHNLLITSCLALATLIVHMIISLRYNWCGMVASAFILGILLSFGALLEAPLFTVGFESTTFIYLKILLLLAVLAGGCITITRTDRKGK